MTQTKIPVKTQPRTVDQILADNAAKPKNKGGRPPGSKNKPKAPPPKQTSIPLERPKDLAEDLAALKVEAQSVTPPPAQQAPPPPPAQQATEQPTPQQQPAAPAVPDAPKQWKLSGHLGLIIVDAFLSSGLALVFNRFLGYDVTKEEFQLTEKELRDLEGLADEVAALIVANPIAMLALALSGCYLGKVPGNAKKKKRDPDNQ